MKWVHTKKVIIIKWVCCNGSVYPCTQTEEYYIHIYVQTVCLRYQTTRTTSLANPPIQTTPPGTPFTVPLHGILPEHGPTICYAYVYIYVYGPACPCCRHNHREHCTDASIALPFSHQVSNPCALIGIHSSVLAAVFDLIRLTYFRLDLTHLFSV